MDLKPDVSVLFVELGELAEALAYPDEGPHFMAQHMTGTWQVKVFTDNIDHPAVDLLGTEPDAASLHPFGLITTEAVALGDALRQAVNTCTNVRDSKEHAA